MAKCRFCLGEGSSGGPGVAGTTCPRCGGTGEVSSGFCGRCNVAFVEGACPQCRSYAQTAPGAAEGERPRGAAASSIGPDFDKAVNRALSAWDRNTTERLEQALRDTPQHLHGALRDYYALVKTLGHQINIREGLHTVASNLVLANAIRTATRSCGHCGGTGNEPQRGDRAQEPGEVELCQSCRGRGY